MKAVFRRSRVVSFAVLAACAPPAPAQEPRLNCRDGKDAPPRLLIVQNLWGLRGYPSAAEEWSDDKKVAEIRAAGFDAFDVWVGGATGKGQPHCDCDG